MRRSVQARRPLIQIAAGRKDGSIVMQEVRSAFEVDACLRQMIAEGLTPLSINEHKAYDPDELDKTIEELERKGFRVEHLGLCWYRVSNPWLFSPNDFGPAGLIKGLEDLRSLVQSRTEMECAT